MIVRWMLVVMLGLFAVPAAQAASFDCSNAGTAFEQAICADPGLSEADETLAVAYATAVGGLSKAALAGMKEGQKSWLAFAERACTPDAEPLNTAYSDDQTACLRDAYSRRIELLGYSAMIGGTRFYTSEAFATAKDPDGTDYQSVATKMLSVPQIDKGDDASAAFNEFVSEQVVAFRDVILAGQDDAGFDVVSDEWRTIKVDKNADQRITLEDTIYQFPHGAAHGQYGVSYLHFLKGENRALVASDIFAADGWQGRLADKAFEALKAKLGEYLQLEKVEDIADAVADPARWNFSPDGLEIIFQPYEVASYADGTPTVTIGWDVLAADLAESAEALKY
jgi:uncharacterized protein